jgi:hypothetical protein
MNNQTEFMKLENLLMDYFKELIFLFLLQSELKKLFDFFKYVKYYLTNNFPFDVLT